MSYGDHWSEPARCGTCGQERSTHDDGECESKKAARAMRAAIRPRCQMPGCSVEVPPTKQYCEACTYVKEDELRRAAGGQ